MQKYDNHAVVDTAKNFLKAINENKVTEYDQKDQLVLKHILGNSIKEYGVIKLLNDVLKNYVDKLCLLDISFKPLEELEPADKKSTSNVVFKIDGNILKAYLPFLPREKFLKVKDELKLTFKFAFRDNDRNDVPYWWKIIRDEAIFVHFKESEILNEIGYEIDNSDQKSLIDRIRESKEHEKKLFDLSSSKSSEIEVPVGFEKLFPFQKVAIEYSKLQDSIFITDKMGLGKTVQSLSILEHHDLYPAIVICPSVLKSNWKLEIELWIPHRTTQILEGGKFPEACDIYILSYGTLITYGLGLSKSPFKAVILDESHYIKNSKTQRTKNVKKYLKSIKKKMLLTGTPILNRPVELVPQLDFLGVLDHFGGQREFTLRYAPPTSNGMWTTYGSANEEELQIELRKCCMIRRNKEDVLEELPDKTRQIISLPLTDRKKYYDIEKDIANWYKKKITEEAESEHIQLTEKQIDLLAQKKKSEMNPLAEKLVKLNYLKQAAAEYKLGSVIEWIDNSLEQTDKIVIFAYHRNIISKLEEKYGKSAVVLKRETKKNVSELVDRFQTDSTIKIFLSSLMIGAFGLTLTAADKLAFVELGWNPGIMEQAEDRIHRIGQKNHTNIYYLLGHSTVDEYIYEMIISKGEMIDKSTNINRIFELLQKKHIKNGF